MKLLNKLVLFSFAVVLTALNAQAARFMVILNNKDVYQQVYSQLTLRQRSFDSVQVHIGSQIQAPFAQATTVQVEESLPTLNTLIVNSQDEKSIEALKNSSAVAFVEKEVFHPAPKPVSGFTRTRPWDYSLAYAQVTASGVGATGPKTPWGIHAVKAPQVWASGNYGQGSRVMILDTGIDKNHPALKANFEDARDFTGESQGLPYPEADTVGHGTHVAGTIAASFGTDGFVGVAPQAKFLMGKVCTEQGCSNIAITQGINWGIVQKVDVISMSLGGPFATAAEKRAVEAAEKAGVTVVAASGNDGAAKVSFPAAFPTVLSVGAVNDHIVKTDFSNWGPELDIVAPGAAVVSSVPQGTGRESNVKVGAPGREAVVPSTSFVGSPDILTPVANDLVFAGLGKPDDFTAAKVSGKFALVQRGEIAFADKVKNAIAAGAQGVVVFNNTAGLMQGAVTQDGSTVSIPVVMIEQAFGERLKASLAAGSAARAIIKTEATDYAAFDGTSMATPHVAGVVALMKSSKRSATPQQVRDAIKSTATALTPNDQNQNGAGMINSQLAVEAVAR